MIRHRKWSPDEEQRLMDAYEDGVGIRGLAERFNRSERSVASRLTVLRKQRGLPARDRRGPWGPRGARDK